MGEKRWEKAERVKKQRKEREKRRFLCTNSMDDILRRRIQKRRLEEAEVIFLFKAEF